jgi:nitroreductase
MEIKEIINKRFSCRSYRSDPVPENILQQVLEAGRLAPTAKNLQPFKIVVIDTVKNQEKLKAIYNREYFLKAPLILGIYGNKKDNWVRSYDNKEHYPVDCAIVMDHMVLTATSLGLGTCWICAFDPVPARALVSLPAEYEPVAFTPLGYPAVQGKPQPKKSLTELVIRI